MLPAYTEGSLQYGLVLKLDEAGKAVGSIFFLKGFPEAEAE